VQWVLHVVGVVSAPKLPQRGHYAGRAEALSHEVLIQSGVFRLIRDSRTPAHLFLQRLPDERSLVEIAEHLGQRLRRDLLADSHRLQFAHDADPSAALHLRGRSRKRARDPRVIECACLEQMGDGRIYVLGRVLTIEKAGAQLGCRQLTPSKKTQAVEIR
jgi:hypothetical protein